MTPERSLKLLLVEDDAALRRVLSLALSEVYSVEAAATYGAAMELVSQAEHLDIAVSDFNLGRGGDGSAVLAHVVARFPACVCVMMSGSSDARVVAAGLEFVKKPIDVDELMNLLAARFRA